MNYNCEKSTNNNYTIFCSSDREIYFNGYINSESIAKLIRQLKECEKKELDSININKRFKELTNFFSEEDKKKLLIMKELENEPIKLFINSFGGEFFQALFAVDQIKTLKVPVHTVVSGIAASAATILSLAGKKRFITKNSHMLIHDLRSGYRLGKKSELLDESENITKLSDLLLNYYAENTKITRDELSKILDRDRYWNATECLDKGLVDEII